MSKGRLSRLMKKIEAARKTEDVMVESTDTLPATYGIKVNGRKFRALGHNTTAEFFIVNEDNGRLIFFPQRRLRKVIIGAEYQEFMRQRALASVPKVPKDKLTLVRRPDLVVPGQPPEPEGA